MPSSAMKIFFGSDTLPSMKRRLTYTYFADIGIATYVSSSLSPGNPRCDQSDENRRLLDSDSLSTE
jgi:hypothetical protein